MIENINYLIDLVGGKNDAINILYFSSGILFSLYLYFRSFCRLVYTSERICEKGREMKKIDIPQEWYFIIMEAKL
jgi:hypothetical protein